MKLAFQRITQFENRPQFHGLKMACVTKFPYLTVFIVLSIVLAAAQADAKSAVYQETYLDSKNDVEFPENESSNSATGRTLLTKSLILAPIGIIVIIGLLLSLLPIPTIVVPGGREIKQYSESTMSLAKKVLASEQCVERISCELHRISRSYSKLSWLPKTLAKFVPEGKWTDKYSRGMINGPCKSFYCDPMQALASP